ncbi:hypothetical protein LTR04_001294, partial [Oleoguttula sp. CCFEE 6159]
MVVPSVSRPRVFLDVHIATEPAGRLVIELFTDKTPKTCENFRALCTGSNPPLTYKLSPFHRVIDEFMIQGGDITKGDGTGGDSIYGGEFEDENIGWRKIDSEGLVCMANYGKGTNSSQFFITLAPCEHLNTKHTIFGHVVSGLPVLERIAKVDVDNKDRPLDPVLIAHCGELERRTRPAAQPSSTIQNTAQDRGREKQRRSPSKTRSPSFNDGAPQRSHAASPPKESDQHRRRSDNNLDSTLRGRPRQRSRHRSRSRAHSPVPDQKSLSHRRYRKRSRSPSRSPVHSHSRSRSPRYRRRRSLPNHYDRRRTGEGDNSDRDGGKDKDRKRGGYREGYRNRDEEARLGADEVERDGGAERYAGVRETYAYRSRGDGKLGGGGGAGRLGGGGAAGDRGGGTEGEIKFKGRGSMKYRERERR